MSTTNSDSHFTQLLKTSHKMVSQDNELLRLFERIYRETLCSFNFENYFEHCTIIPLANKCHALRTACIAVRDHTVALKEAASGEGLEKYNQIYYQIWTPILATDLKQLEVQGKKIPKNNPKSKAPQASTKEKSARPVPQELRTEIVSQLQNAANGILYPKLCDVPACKWCYEKLFSAIPLTRCNPIHCTMHSGCTYYPHLKPKVLQYLLESKSHGSGTYAYKSTAGGTYINPLPSTGFAPRPKIHPATDAQCSMDSLNIADEQLDYEPEVPPPRLDDFVSTAAPLSTSLAAEGSSWPVVGKEPKRTARPPNKRSGSNPSKVSKRVSRRH